VTKLDTGVPYALFAYTGLLAWNFSASSWRFSVNSLTSNAGLVTKVYFPREIFPFSAVLVSLVDFAVGAIPLVALMIYYGVRPTPALLFLPVVLAVHVMFTMAVGLLLAIANLFYRDVKYLFEVFITIWMFATSVVYPVERVGGKLAVLLQLNPMTPIIEGYRSTIVRGTMPDAAPFAIAAALSLVALVACWVGFHRAEFSFAENI
jgi:ABC-type polysaccharide/polyol phosphate export permease